MLVTKFTEIFVSIITDHTVMSWEEFEREVLPTGEVKRLICNPGVGHKGKFELYTAATFKQRKVL